MFLILALASMLISSIAIALPDRVEAGSNGQQLKIYYRISASDCPTRVVVRGYNQNGQYTTWSGPGYCDNIYVTTDNFWWKGRVWVEVTYRRPNGTTYAVGVGVTVPQTYASDWYPICLPNAISCRQ